MTASFTIVKSITTRIIFGILASIVLFIALMEFFSLSQSENTIMAIQTPQNIESLAMKSLEDELGLIEQEPLLSKLEVLAIYKVFNEGDLVINSIYAAIFSMLLIHIIVVLNHQSLQVHKVDAILTWTTYAAAGLGTLGTMYAIAFALHGAQSELSNLNDIVQKAFFDAIYTTILGLSVSVINQGISVFVASKESK